MDAGVLAAGRSPTDGTLAPLAETLDNLRAWLDPEGGHDGADLIASVTEALDEEVARWTPELRTITTSLLDHNFDERTGLPRNVSAADPSPSDDAVTIGNYVEFLLDARELVDG